jgi:hypothetical protein
MSHRRLWATLSLLIGAAVAVFAALLAVRQFPNGLSVLGCLLLAAGAAWFGLVRRGPGRFVGWAAAVLLLAAAVVLVIVERSLFENLLVVAGTVATLACATAAFAVRVHLPPAPRPRRPVVFMNPRSGGGKVESLGLVDEARARGIEPIMLEPGDDLAKLVSDAVAQGADALAMAGGDGSQAAVAAIAAERRLPYACIPAGTRNHFARDLGIDRRDAAGALDALVDGGERVVDLAEVNGRVFVNNVSMGLYADAVQRTGYRAAKLRTLLDTVPDVLGPGGYELDLRWVDPDGREHGSIAAILVSNNRYRIGHLLGAGTRARLDGGTLGIAVVAAVEQAVPWREWHQQTFEVHSDRPVAAGIDGEAVELDGPIRFRTMPAALRVRIARTHPGASPSAAAPESLWDAVRKLAAIAAGRDQGTSGAPGRRARPG